MPPIRAFPGVYIEETPMHVRSIPAVATAITVIMGWGAKGPADRAQRVTSFADFERVFGGLDQRSVLGYSVKHFFENGGPGAQVIRLLADNARTAAVTLGSLLQVTASSPGAWANEYAVELRASDRDPARLRFIVRRQLADAEEKRVEDFEDLSLLPGDERSI